MPSKPLLGMPEVVGTSAAVMAIRSTLGCCCASAGEVPHPRRAAARAAAVVDLRRAVMVPLPPTEGSVRQGRAGATTRATAGGQLLGILIQPMAAAMQST